jgi:cytochrome P450
MDELIRILKRYYARVQDALTSEPVRRAVYSLLRRFRPVLRVGNRVFVSRLADVQQVLRTHDVFSVRSYGVRMRETAGDFLLGHDDAQHDRDRNLAGQVMKSIDQAQGERVFALALATAQKVIQSRLSAGDQLDVVKDLADEIPVAMVADYFGVANPGGRSLLEWVQDMSWYIFNPLASAADRERGVRAGSQLREHVSRLVRATPRPTPTRNVLEGLMSATGDQAVVVRTICGLVAGSLGPPPRQFVRAVDHLLELEGTERQRLHDAAAAGDRLVVSRFVREASRLCPDPSVLYRTCERSYLLNDWPIDAGRMVICLIESALLDESQIDEPLRLRPSRPVEEQMMFGLELHRCMGEELGMELLTGMAIPLFALTGLRRAAGRAGRVQHGELGSYPAQNYPQHLMVGYDDKP